MTQFFSGFTKSWTVSLRPKQKGNRKCHPLPSRVNLRFFTVARGRFAAPTQRHLLPHGQGFLQHFQKFMIQNRLKTLSQGKEGGNYTAHDQVALMISKSLSHYGRCRMAVLCIFSERTKLNFSSMKGLTFSFFLKFQMCFHQLTFMFRNNKKVQKKPKDFDPAKLIFAPFLVKWHRPAKG